MNIVASGEPTKSVFKSHYLAALEMLRSAVDACPESMWDDPAYKNRFWRVAYHALFYTDLYLSRTEQDFRPWERYVHKAVFLGIIPWEPERGEASAEQMLAVKNEELELYQKVNNFIY